MKNEQDKGLQNRKQHELSEEEMDNVAGGGRTGVGSIVIELDVNKWKEMALEQGYESRHKNPCHSCGAGAVHCSSVYFLSYYINYSSGCGVCVDNKCFACGRETKYLQWETGYPY